jgi:hypothetical protein
MPLEELPRWAQVHLQEYGKAKILALIGGPRQGRKLLGWGVGDPHTRKPPSHAQRCAHAATATAAPAEAMGEAYGVKRAQKAALLERLNAELDEFA